MPVVPNFVERTLFLSLNQRPGLVLAAIRVDVFETLASGPLRVPDLAQRIKTDVQGVQRKSVVEENGSSAGCKRNGRATSK